MGLLQEGGLTIVDIYSEWAGPCTAMSGALKKIKLEVGDDSLVYAMAKSDTIPQLEKFRGHCKPTYLFMASGEPVAVMHGANAPLMRTMVSQQMELEKRVLAGEIERSVIELVYAVPLSAKDRESQDYKKENDDNEKPSEDNQDAKQEDLSNVDEVMTEEGSEDNAKNEEIDKVNEFVETENKRVEDERVEQNLESESTEECKQDNNNNVDIEE